MKKRIFLSALLLVLICCLCGCQCSHEWVDANCLDPQTCTKCGETEGLPLGHTWTTATCFSPKVCSTCSMSEGKPLDHIPGEWMSRMDIISAEFLEEQRCSVCGLLLQSQVSDLDTLVLDDCFLCTPRELLDRLIHFASTSYPDISYEFVPDEDLFVNLHYNNQTAHILFFDDAGIPLTSNDADSLAVWYWGITKVAATPESSGQLIEYDLASAFYYACDPSMDASTIEYLSMMNLYAYMNSIESNETYSYDSHNGLLYEFGYQKNAISSFAADSISVYASSDWQYDDTDTIPESTRSDDGLLHIISPEAYFGYADDKQFPKDKTCFVFNLGEFDKRSIDNYIIMLTSEYDLSVKHSYKIKDTEDYYHSLTRNGVICTMIYWDNSEGLLTITFFDKVARIE